ncbi:MAG TPA: L-rhamnose mutarotase [Thermomicrobiales bacterium]|nr:L-rhamnose mutarotase [Thermomicrobiales bacterium]
MARIAFRMRVQEGKLDEYIAHHAAVWPELLNDMHEAGFRNYSIFHDGLDLFAFLECDDWEAANARLAESDANRRWQAFMSNYLEAPVDAESGPSRLMPEIFRME